VLFIFVLLSFFFQAEDGIRDRNVTGVQTCALPISSDAFILNVCFTLAAGLAWGAWLRDAFERQRRGELAPHWLALGVAASLIGRSEERRVGKASRLRGESDGEKKEVYK